MNLFLAFAAFAIICVLGLFGATRLGARAIERRNPPVGSFADVAGTRMHYIHVQAEPNADLPPIVFIHGASSNLKDLMRPLRPMLEGRADLLFIDRPGHGWSGRGNGNNENPAGQADTLAGLMDKLGTGPAIIVGHSYGGAVAATFAVNHPGKTKGLLFLSPATHPWPGGDVTWYYTLASMPLLGWLFTRTLALPGGLLSMDAGIAGVFAPNAVPQGYAQNAGIELVLRPETFRANSRDVAGLFAHVCRFAPRYPEIRVPTVIITGDHDDVVLAEIHSAGLERDIAGSELVWIRNMGHRPDYVATGLDVMAIEKIAGSDRDLQGAARLLEARIGNNSFGLAVYHRQPE
ncbi:alpha/beta fold hydrolase [Phyllobacterium myrsinacearum]|uniref:Pimeloyl-ACP methyl ester carboxylesterase n=1 Tax=Phyllobacterium myrsinacearum TaxID=28101 RepID=A0A839EIL9_9HYPH|nr:alpha/beta hydrolase [Phyllobacterium myrsinacearum]MBA8878188.1 pimeloyl-ACP methyl ester carboxylesterase [Phyllobacterium myrsinacearum]